MLSSNRKSPQLNDLSCFNFRKLGNAVLALYYRAKANVAALPDNAAVIYYRTAIDDTALFDLCIGIYHSFRKYDCTHFNSSSRANIRRIVNDRRDFYTLANQLINPFYPALVISKSRIDLGFIIRKFGIVGTFAERVKALVIVKKANAFVLLRLPCNIGNSPAVTTCANDYQPHTGSPNVSG